MSRHSSLAASRFWGAMKRCSVARKSAAQISHDDEAAGREASTEFDTRAVLTFYRELAERPDDALVEVACPS